MGYFGKRGGVLWLHYRVLVHAPQEAGCAVRGGGTTPNHHATACGHGPTNATACGHGPTNATACGDGTTDATACGYGATSAVRGQCSLCADGRTQDIYKAAAHVLPPAARKR